MIRVGAGLRGSLGLKDRGPKTPSVVKLRHMSSVTDGSLERAFATRSVATGRLSLGHTSKGIVDVLESLGRVSATSPNMTPRSYGGAARPRRGPWQDAVGAFTALNHD